MNISKYLDEMRNIEENFLEFLDDVENGDKSFQNLKIKFEDMKIRDNKHDLRLILHIISSICDNHHRCPTFFDKIERILLYFKADIKKYYSNSEIFNIFNHNKRILLFFIKEKIIIVDKYVAKKITSNPFRFKNYPQYFMPEIKQYENEKWFPKDELETDLERELPDDFDEMRNKGENDSFICKLIREDSVEDFIAYVNKNCISPNANINPSIYETNPFLLFHLSKPLGRVTLIEYAAFFGSIQIFKYLKDAKAELIPYLYIFGIHSNNAELINYLDEHFIEPNTTNEKVESLFKELFYESFKCHHNEIAIYFINKCLQNQYENSKAAFIQSLKYYNFSFLQNELVNESSFCYLCNFDYYSLVKYLLTIRGADVNSKTI